jgi:phosphatidylglycerol:prolipoprotein diacylglycerol transferase
VIGFLGFTIPVGPVSVLLAFLVASDIGGRAIGWLPASSAPPARRDSWMDAYGNGIFYGLIVGVVGARLGYAAQYANLYLQDPAMLLSIRPGTLALGPGVLLGSATALWILHRRGVPFSVSVDASALGLTAGLLVVKLGQFLTGDAFGTPTAAAWGVYLWQATRHPVQLYFAGALFVLFGHGSCGGRSIITIE